MLDMCGALGGHLGSEQLVIHYLSAPLTGFSRAYGEKTGRETARIAPHAILPWILNFGSSDGRPAA
jgi:hypothetical protein